MAVPFLDLTRQNRQVRDQAVAIFHDAVEHSAFIGGKRVEEFEQNFARFCGARFGISIKSGTDALRLAIAACGLEPGDEVITSPFTFIATAEVITQNGGKVVFTDIDPDTYNLDPRQLEKHITPRTRGIIRPLYGNQPRHGRHHEIAAGAALGPGGRLRPWHHLGGRWLAASALRRLHFCPTRNMGARRGQLAATQDGPGRRIQARQPRAGVFVHDFRVQPPGDAIQAGILNEKLKLLPA
jgi:hypothetical protein